MAQNKLLILEGLQTALLNGFLCKKIIESWIIQYNFIFIHDNIWIHLKPVSQEGYCYICTQTSKDTYICTECYL